MCFIDNFKRRCEQEDLARYNIATVNNKIKVLQSKTKEDTKEIYVLNINIFIV